MVSDMLDLDASLFELNSNESLAVYSPFLLWTMICQQDRLECLMKVLRSINPCVIFVDENEANINSTVFVNRFTEALFYYGAYFDCLENCLSDDPARNILEFINYGHAIENILVLEKEERTARYVKVNVWKTFFTRFNMAQIEPSTYSLYQARVVQRGNIVRMQDVVHNEKWLYLICEYLDLDLKQHMDPSPEFGQDPRLIKLAGFGLARAIEIPVRTFPHAEQQPATYILKDDKTQRVNDDKSMCEMVCDDESGGSPQRKKAYIQFVVQEAPMMISQEVESMCHQIIKTGEQFKEFFAPTEPVKQGMTLDHELILGALLLRLCGEKCIQQFDPDGGTFIVLDCVISMLMKQYGALPTSLDHSIPTIYDSTNTIPSKYPTFKIPCYCSRVTISETMQFVSND